VLVRQGKIEEAILHFRRALQIARDKKAYYLAEEISRRLKYVEARK